MDRIDISPRIELLGKSGLRIQRFFTKPGENVFDKIEWETRTSSIKNPDGTVVFEMQNVEVPKFWSQVATDVLAQKNMRKLGVPQLDKDGKQIVDDFGKPVLGSETSAKQVIKRLAGCWRYWGEKYNYFASPEDAQAFEDEITHMLIYQMAAPNSPQWYNTGLNLSYCIEGPPQGHWYVNPDTKQLVEAKDAYSHPQVHACFIQSINDDLVNEGGILNLLVKETRIFKYGSGSGTNFSTLRAQGEPLSGGGTSSGVMSFLKIFDINARAIKSGGTTRRAAKMVILNIDHPDIEEFINWKCNEEKKVAAMVAAGYSSDFEGEAYQTVSGQNSNNSIRVTDEFIQSVIEDKDWNLRFRTNGQIAKTVKARYLWDQIANAAWTCADPGLQFDTTINDWHTCPASGRINASNPCVTGDTLVSLADGKRVRIDSIVGQKADILNKENKKAKIAGSFVTGVKKVYKLTTKSGYSIKVTEDHKIFTVNKGFVEAKDLRKDDLIKLEENSIESIPESENKNLYQMFGAYLGDGYFTGEQLFISMNSNERGIIQNFVNYINNNFISTSVNGLNLNVQDLKSVSRISTNRKSLIEKFRNLGAKNIPSFEKRIQQWIFSSDLTTQKAILQGLFTTDGTVGNYGKKSQYISLDSSSLGLLEDVQKILLNFGIKSKIYKNRRAGNLTSILPDGRGGSKKYKVKEMHALRITRDSRIKFEKLIGFMEGSEKSKKLTQMNRKVKTYKDKFYDKFDLLEFAGIETVYDLSEPITNSFIANGIVVHNCSEYMFIDNTACNLASINLRKFFDEETAIFDVEAFKHAVRLWTIVLEISVLMAGYPSKEIADLSYKFRTLGLGYTNLGSMMMVAGIPYDSNEARTITSAITAIMTGESYATSAEIASFLGPFSEYEKNKEYMLRVIRNHRRVVYNAKPEEYEKLATIPPGIDHKICPEYLLSAAIESWDRALELGEKYGYRNAQTTSIAPTGTISLIMDCDTTGIEPDFALVKFKKLVGGGYFKLINQGVVPALKRLGYLDTQIKEIINYAVGTNSLVGSPHINAKTLKNKGLSDTDIVKIEKSLPTVFELQYAFTPVVLGKPSIEKLGFMEKEFSKPNFNLLKALGFSENEIEAANEYICGTMTIEGAPHLNKDNYAVFDCANKCGKKGKRFIDYMAHVKMMTAAQPLLSGSISKTINMPNEATVDDVKRIYFESWRLALKSIALYRDGSKLSQPLTALLSKQESQKQETPKRKKLPDERKAITHKFRVGNQEGYITVGLYEDGQPGELFVTMSKEGSTLSGLMGSFALSISIALQYGVPLKALVTKLTHTRYEPSGWTDNPQIQVAKSLTDYIARWLALKFLPKEDLEQIGLNGFPHTETPPAPAKPEEQKNLQEFKEQKFDFDSNADAPTCDLCGSLMIRSGTCYLCINCGSTTGCG